VWSGPGTRVSGLFLGLREKARGGRAISRSHLPSRKIPSNFQELPAVAAVVNRSDLSENTPMWLQRTLPQDSLRAQHTLRHLPLLLSVSHLGPKCSACSPTQLPLNRASFLFLSYRWCPPSLTLVSLLSTLEPEVNPWLPTALTATAVLLHAFFHKQLSTKHLLFAGNKQRARNK
jgi:hypothetical protein